MTTQRSIVRVALIGAVVLMHSADTIRADESIWPQYRGPKGAAHAAEGQKTVCAGGAVIALSQRLGTIPEPIESIPRLEVSYPDIVDLMPVVAVCVISVMSIALWSLLVWRYIPNKMRPENTNKL